MMDQFADWVDKKIVQYLFGGALIGIGSAFVRGRNDRDKPKAFLWRLIVGALMASFTSYLISDIDMGRAVYGIIVWFAGWFGAEAGSLLALGGKKAGQGIKIIPEDEPKKEDDEHRTNS